MRKSPEIQAIAEQSLRDQAARGVEALIDVTSREPGFLSIGTAPSEWISGFTEFEQAMRAAGTTDGGFPQLENREIEAYEEGTVGWGFIRGDIKLPNGVTLKVRQTFVVHQEGSGWKIVQNHSSVGIPD